MSSFPCPAPAPTPKLIRNGAAPGVGLVLSFGSDPAAIERAVAHLEDRGFRVGPMSGRLPRGFAFEADVAPWPWPRLWPIEREYGLDGRITVDVCTKEVRAHLYAHAPIRAREAFVEHWVPRDLGASIILRSADIAAVATLLFVIGAIAYVGWHPVFSRSPEPATKITLRAGPLRAVTMEARR